MNGFDEDRLAKGHLRKLEALCKPLGTDIADEVFAKWVAKQGKVVPENRNAATVAETLMPLARQVENSARRLPRSPRPGDRGACKRKGNRGTSPWAGNCPPNNG